MYQASVAVMIQWFMNYMEAEIVQMVANFRKHNKVNSKQAAHLGLLTLAIASLFHITANLHSSSLRHSFCYPLATNPNGMEVTIAKYMYLSTKLALVVEAELNCRCLSIDYVTAARKFGMLGKPITISHRKLITLYFLNPTTKRKNNMGTYCRKECNLPLVYPSPHIISTNCTFSHWINMPIGFVQMLPTAFILP